jgi:hypothetical protein
MIQHNSPELNPQPPLSVVLERLDLTPDGHFRPAAFIKLTKAFRTSGLLQALPPEELKSFFTLLSFLTSNGDCSPTLAQIASAMRVSHGKAKARIQRLAQFRFEGEPLIASAAHGDGQEAYALRSRFIPVIEQPVEEAKPETIKPVPREQIIEYSRNRYAKTREEVEKQIAEINGWKMSQQSEEVSGGTVPGLSQQEEPPHLKELRRRLQSAGIAPDQVEYLLTTFDLERIEKQLQWLPFRQARNPSAYLVAAIIGDYEEPIYRR